MNHSRIALLDGNVDRFKRTDLMVLHDEAIKKGSNRIPSKVDPVQCECWAAKAIGASPCFLGF